MKSEILSLVMLAVVSASACNETPTDSGTIPKPGAIQVEIAPDRLFGHWVRSQEEEQPGDKTQVFRPAGFKEFPPSRFRMAYKFSSGGVCEWFYLAPDDEHRFKPGKWTLDPKDEKILRISAEGATTSFKVAALTEDRLLLVPVEEEKGN